MLRFWDRMTEIFGRQWEANFGTVEGSAFTTWAQGLADLSLPQIALGFDALVKAGGEYPPNLPKFRSLCGHDANRVQTYANRNFTQDRISQFSVAKLIAPQEGDSPIAKKAKIQMAAILQNLPTYEVDGIQHKVESIDQSYHGCGCVGRWGNRAGAQF